MSSNDHKKPDADESITPPDADPIEKTPLELSIEIDPDGRVVFTDLPPELIDVVLALDPDAVIACSTDTDAEPEDHEEGADPNAEDPA